MQSHLVRGLNHRLQPPVSRTARRDENRPGSVGSADQILSDAIAWIDDQSGGRTVPRRRAIQLDHKLLVCRHVPTDHALQANPRDRATDRDGSRLRNRDGVVDADGHGGKAVSGGGSGDQARVVPTP